MPKEKKNITNKSLAGLFFSSQWLIEEKFAREEMSRYLREESQIAAGGKYSDLSISERREDKASVIVDANGNISPLSASTIEAAGGGLIAVHKIKGTMFAEDQLSTRGASSIADGIRKADSSPNIDAHVIEVNSGGGQASSAPIIAGAIKDATKPVIAFVHQAASAAYWAISESDEIIMASKSSMAGSLGVLTKIDKLLAAFEDEIFDEIYSDLSPDKNSEWRAYKAGNTGPLKAHLNKLAKILQNDIKASRSLDADLMQSTLAGGMFFANDSIKRGLADRIGTFGDAISRARVWKKKKKRNNSNSTNMNFKETKLYALVAKYFGSEPESEEKAIETLTEHLDASTKAEKALSDANAKIEALTEQLTEAKATSDANSKTQSEAIEGVKALIEEMKTGYESKIEALTNDIVAIKGTKSGNTGDDKNLETGKEQKPAEAKGVKLGFISENSGVKVVIPN